jgi:hypothetical protein
MIEAKLGKHLVGGTMLVLYRGAAGGAYKEAALERADGCTYKGTIPGENIAAPKVEYYLEARLKDGRPSARRGKAKQPYTVNVSFGAVAPQVEEPAPEEPTPTEEPKDEEPKTDEVEDLLLNKPKSPKGSSCGGCATNEDMGSGVVTWGSVFLLLVLAGRRKRDLFVARFTRHSWRS